MILSILAILAFVWQTEFGGPTLSDSVAITSTTTDSSGNVIYAGYMTGSVNYGGGVLTVTGNPSDVVVGKVTAAAGAYSWAVRFGSTGTDRAFGVSTDSSGNVYVTGSFQGTVNFGGGNLVSAGNSDVFILKLNSSGAHVWSYRFGGTGNDVGNAISAMSDGTFAITGYYAQLGTTIDFGGGGLPLTGGSDIFVAKFDSSGTHQWSKGIGGGGADTGLGVAINSAGVVAMTGGFNGNITFNCGSISTAGGEDGLVMQFTSTGLITWVRRLAGSGTDRGASIAIGPSNEVAVTGTFSGTINLGGTAYPSSGGGSDIFLVKYSSTGAWVWDDTWGGITGTFGDSVKGVAIDSSGNVAITGYMVNGLDFGGGALCPLCSTYDAFVAKFTTAGVYVSASRFSNVSNDEFGNAVTFDTSGNMIIGGTFVDNINLGGGEMPSPGGNDGFLGKFSP